MEVRLACIVEGHGEVSAVPVLIRRIAALFDAGLAVRIPQPIRTPRDKLLKEGELERAVELAARKVASSGAVLVLLDAHRACPAQLGPSCSNELSRPAANWPSRSWWPNKSMKHGF